jgi:uncharacterized membrane protein
MTMTVLLLGLLVFLGTHSIRIFADGWRTRQIAQRGEGTWKVAFSLMSAVGLGLIVWGYAIARAQPMVLWIAPVWGRHLAGLLNLAAFVLIAGAYVPGNTIKAKWGHPMVLGVKVWAFAHLLANGTLNAVVLFGAFLAWAIADFASARRRDRKAGILYPAGSLARDGIMVIVGIVAWAAFAFLLHGRLIGVRPFG